jgi:hypothetical protein
MLFLSNDGNMAEMPKAAFWIEKYEHLLQEDIAAVNPNYKAHLRSFIRGRKMISS